VLEIGTLGEHSTLWLVGAAGGRAGGESRVQPHHADVACANPASAGVGDLVEIRIGDAWVSLAAMIDAGTEPLDLAFIDPIGSRTPSTARRS
jgi:predicted O-methyltransferase YrrM